MNDMPLNNASVVVTYAGASWANFEDCRSQVGTLALLPPPKVQQRTTVGLLLDLQSGRSTCMTRMCRSTLAAEACAADEACDKGTDQNRFLSELLYGKIAYKSGHGFSTCT